jgi:hypothetical protein
VIKEDEANEEEWDPEVGWTEAERPPIGHDELNHDVGKGKQNRKLEGGELDWEKIKRACHRKAKRNRQPTFVLKDKEKDSKKKQTPQN